MGYFLKPWASSHSVPAALFTRWLCLGKLSLRCRQVLYAKAPIPRLLCPRESCAGEQRLCLAKSPRDKHAHSFTVVFDALFRGFATTNDMLLTSRNIASSSTAAQANACGPARPRACKTSRRGKHPRFVALLSFCSFAISNIKPLAMRSTASFGAADSTNLSAPCPPA